MQEANLLPYTYFNRKKLKGGYKHYWRFRRDGMDCALPGDPRGGGKALQKYAELIAQCETVAADKVPASRSSFEWLARSYLASAEHRQLAESTKLDYGKVIENRLIPILGPERFDCITRASIKTVRDSVLAEGLSVRTANKVKQLTSLIYSWAEEEDLLPEGFLNPGMKLKKLRNKSQPIEIWSDEEIALYLAACKSHMRTAVMLALHTGQRCEDIVQMEWSDFQPNETGRAFIRVRQNKTGEPLTIPCHPELTKYLTGIKTRFGGLMLRSATGKPMNANSLQSAMTRSILTIAGMPRRSMHGLRYAAAGRLEAAGCTVVQISSMIGHRTYQMAMKYARQRSDAEAAMARLEQRA